MLWRVVALCLSAAIVVVGGFWFATAYLLPPFMTEDERFWWNFVLQSIVALATLGAVWAALFGRWFHGKFMPPKLHLWVNDNQGDRQFSRYGDGVTTETIWYHVRVRNERRAFSPATRVEVRLLSIEELGKGGAPWIIWRGEALMSWRSEKRLGKTDLIIGAPYDCDAFSVSKIGRLRIAPKTAGPFVFETECHLVLTLQALSLEGDSVPTRFEIKWNGKWPRHEDGHLAFQEYTSAQPEACANDSSSLRTPPSAHAEDKA